MKAYLLTLGILIALSSAFTCTEARASVLTFDITGISNNQIVNSAYGDNITAATVGSFSYGAANGFTPDVTVDYGPASPKLWTTQFGDLTNVLISSSPDPNLLILTFTAENGFNVSLHSFDLVGWTPGFSLDPTINSVKVFDGNNNVLFTQTNPTISIVSHTSFTFGTPLAAQVLKVQIDALNIDSDDIGIDNINFSQSSTGQITGDYNHNGVVDAADYTVWRDTLGQAGAGLAADGTGPGGVPDGVVNQLDYDFWKANFGQHDGSGSGPLTAVPEPVTPRLLLVGVLTMWSRRRSTVPKTHLPVRRVV
jgi:hypothetical protein